MTAQLREFDDWGAWQVSETACREETEDMDENVWDAIRDTLRALVRPTTGPAPDGIPRVALLYADLGDFDRADAKLSVVYRHQTADTQSLIGADIASHDLIPPFDVLCVNLPDGQETDALSFALRFLRVRRPEMFLLPSVRQELPQADEFLHTVRGRTHGLGYRVYGNDHVIVGMLGHPDSDGRIRAMLDASLG